MRKGEETRDRIIAQAAPIFNTRGVTGSSMQDVMEATGLEKGGIYRHFNSKEELAEAAFRYAVGKAVRLRTEKIDSAHGAVQQLRSIVKRFVEAPSAIPGGCPLMNTAIESDDANPRMRELARKSFADWRDRLAAVVQEGIDRGEIRAKTEPRRIANTMIATLEGALMLSRIERSNVPLQDAQASLEPLFEAIARGKARKD